MAFATPANGLGPFGMGAEHRCGRMARDTTVTLLMIDKRASDVLSMQMVTFILATGKTTNRMVKAPTSTRMVHHTRATGSMTNTMVQARSTGPMALHIQANTNRGRNMAMVCSSGRMAAVMMASS